MLNMVGDSLYPSLTDRRLYLSCREGPGPDADRPAWYILHGYGGVSSVAGAVNDGGLRELARRLEWSMRLIPRPRCRQSTLGRFSDGKLAGETTGESCLHRMARCV